MSANGSEEKKITFDRNAFWSRLQNIFSSWKTSGPAWGAADEKSAPVDAVVIFAGPNDEDATYSRSSAIQLMLFGYELQDTIFVFSQNTLTVLTSSKKANLLDALGESHGPLRLKTLVKTVADKNAAHFNTLIQTIKASGQGKRVGIVKKDEVKGNFGAKFKSLLEEAGMELVDVGSGLAQPLMIKDEAALKTLTSAAQFTARVLKNYLLPEIENIIEEEKKVTHSKLAEDTEEVLMTPSKVGAKLDVSDVEVCYTPIVMSGGNYDLKPSAQSNDDIMEYDTIICALGARYKSYCSNICRTYFINPTQFQKESYGILLGIWQACLGALRANNKASTVWTVAMNVIKRTKPELEKHFTKNCGFGIGLEFRETEMLLNARNNTVLRPGMTFNLCVGFENLTANGVPKGDKDEGKMFAMMLADTVVVRPEGSAEPLTNCARKYDEVSYSIGDDANAAPADADDSTDVVIPDEIQGKRTRTAERKAAFQPSDSEAKRIEEHQARLAAKKHSEALRRFAAQQIGEGFSNEVVREGKWVSYNNVSEMPPIASRNSITVDANAESILLPLHGNLVPFHVQTIKNVHRSEEADGFITLRITFHIPPQTAAAKSEVPTFSDPSAKWIRELTFRTRSTALNKAFFEIQELRKRVQNRVKEHEAKRSLVEQEELVVDEKKGAIARLRDLQIRPHLTGRRTDGVLSAHTNGFRFISNQKQKIDIIYKNIKHAFFQPADKQSINVILHFELHNPIMLGKKKTQKSNFVQFFVEIMEASQDVDGRTRYQDEDGLLEEQEERRNRMRWNERFRAFVKSVENGLAGTQHKLEFDGPYRELAFSGVPNKTTVELLPTVHALVALDDAPPLVISLEDIEIAHFERVQFNLRNFDLAFVFKDLEKPIVRVDAIPMSSLEDVKRWLNSCNIVFYESKHNVNWKKVLKDIKADIKGFLEDGGWQNLRPEVDVVQEEVEDMSEESEFEADSESEHSEEFSDGSEVDEDDDEYSGSSDDDDDDEEEGEGDDWDALEEQAKQDDARKRRREEEEDALDRPVKKRTAPAKPKARSAALPSARPKMAARPGMPRPAAPGAARPGMAPRPGMAGRPAPAKSAVRPGGARPGGAARPVAPVRR